MGKNVFASLDEYSDSLAEAFRPGKPWYSKFRETVNPSSNIFTRWLRDQKDKVFLREHPAIETGKAIIKASPDDPQTPVVKYGAWAYRTITWPVRSAWSVGRWLSQHRPSRTQVVILVLATGTLYLVVRWYRRTRHITVVQVTNPGEMYSHGRLREYFSASIETMRIPQRQIGKHLCLAAERRHLEYAVHRWFSNQRMRFRDIGGSRLRGQEFNHLKHLCLPILDGSDIMRAAKAPRPNFNVCAFKGQQCPMKHSFPGALLSHVDYYLTPSELADCVINHTFVISHNFDGEEGNFYEEMNWTKHGVIVTSDTDDGTPYSHSWNLWRSEGVLVGRNSACVYARVGKTAHTSIYYCYPAPGIYASDDPNRLVRQSDLAKYTLPNGSYALFYPGQGGKQDFFRIFDDQHHATCVGPKAMLEKVLMKMGDAARDPKFNSTLKSYAVAQANAHQIVVDDGAAFVDLLYQLAQEFAFDVSVDWLYNWDLCHLNLWTRLRLRYLDYTRVLFRRMARPIASDTIRGPVISWLTPWAFTEIALPGYVNLTEPMRVNVSGVDPGPRPFRYEREVIDAQPDHGQPRSTSGVYGEYDSEYRAQSAGADSGYASRNRIQSEAENSDGNARSHPSPVRFAEPDPDVHRPRMAVSGVRRDADPLVNIQRSGIPNPSLLFIRCQPTSGALFITGVLLEDPANGDGELYTDLFLDPFLLNPDQARLVRERLPDLADTLQYARLHRLSERPARFLIGEFLRNHGAPPPDTPPESGGGVPALPGDVLDEGTPPADGIREVGQALPQLATRHAPQRERPRTQRRNHRAGRRSQELREARDISQVHRPTQHIAQIRQVRGGHGAVHRRHRGSLQDVSLLNQRIDPGRASH